LDYLLKPIDADELKETYNRFIEKSAIRHSKDAAVKNLLSNLQQENKTRHKLALPTLNGLEFFLPQDIIRCEGMSNYTKFYFANHHSIITSKTIKEYEEILTPHQFVRIHKSHLVNADFVTGYAAATGNLIMEDGSQVEVSRRRKKEVLDMLGLRS
jgi:two-component system LytT family response regulator